MLWQWNRQTRAGRPTQRKPSSTFHNVVVVAPPSVLLDQIKARGLWSTGQGISALRANYAGHTAIQCWLRIPDYVVLQQSVLKLACSIAVSSCMAAVI
jgi:hypothetical protein